jgi:membrane protein implicated in regulation of membrane protease activity
MQTPTPPGGEFTVSGNMAGWELALILFVVLGAVVAIAYPFLRRLAGSKEREHIALLEQRIAELEERVDFAERLLPRPATTDAEDDPKRSFGP